MKSLSSEKPELFQPLEFKSQNVIFPPTVCYSKYELGSEKGLHCSSHSRLTHETLQKGGKEE